MFVLDEALGAAYAGSTKNNGWSYSIGVLSFTNTFTMVPDTSDSISLNSFIASMIHTVSPFLIRIFMRTVALALGVVAAISDHLRSKRHNLCEVALTQFTGNRSENSSALGIVVVS